ncbi:hypothetical protein BOTNAR_0493g00010 [Botryotinia narcissicola]|uniref:2EXR domain-containing protein n=1 Tax=Botryotinia narcissicola TaxID=278944 RepID=A0A4Z1HTE6_9HELO|nr:hypothetical protein BOTNAR_0493g00010 [Botryotinia narcissicola]
MQDIRLQKSIAESADTNLPLTIPMFHQFPLLPLEIQSKIWSFAALHSRTIPILTHWTPPDNLDSPTSPSSWDEVLELRKLYAIRVYASELALTCVYSLISQQYLDENGLLIDGDYEITRGFYINPSVDILYFTSHVEDHYFKYYTHWNGTEPTDSEECSFLENICFPVEEVMELLMEFSEITKAIRYLAFNLGLPGIDHRILGFKGLDLSRDGNWTGLESVIFCLEGIDGVDNAAQKDDQPEDSKGKGKEVANFDKKENSRSSAVDLEREIKLYGIRESFTGPWAGRGNALFKKCMSEYSKFSADYICQSESWFECFKPTGSLGVDGRPAVTYTDSIGLGTPEQNDNKDGEERLDILPIIGFGVVSNYISDEERDSGGLEENPFERMCYDGSGSFEKDEANENSVFGYSVVMGED